MRKDSARIDCNGAVDEAQAAIGLARALVGSGGAPAPDWLGDLLVTVERDLWVLMAEVATAPRNRARLTPAASLVTPDMVGALENKVHEIEASIEMPAEFVVPGEDVASAALDVARTVVRRAERLAVKAAVAPDSQVVPYLNRLSDLIWLLARVVEGHHRTARSA